MTSEKCTMERQREGPTGLSVMCNKCRMDKEEGERERADIGDGGGG